MQSIGVGNISRKWLASKMLDEEYERVKAEQEEMLAAAEVGLF